MCFNMRMKTEVVNVDPERPDPAAIGNAAEVLMRGGLVAFPTETVYGLGADALDADAVRRIFEAKGRPATNPVIVHVADAASAARVVSEWPEAAQRLAERFWPGPLTLVLAKASSVPDVVTAGGPTVAVRVPAHPVAHALIQAAGLPIAAPSANRSTQVSPTRAEHVLRGLNARIEVILDAGPTRGGIESTVLDLTTDPPRLLRPGLVMPAQIEEVIGPITRTPGTTGGTGPLPSPGMMARHYAPQATVELVAADARARMEELFQTGVQVGWLSLQAAQPGGTVHIPMPADPAAYSARLYAALHEMDDAGVERILIDLPPDSEEWMAVHDRLRRAAS
jgi:L-threonylcarbamoyladenylate synthase